VLVKELASEAYSVEAYFLAKGICELPVSTVLPAAFFMVLWPLVGLPWAALPLAYAVSLLISWTSSSLAVLVSAAVFDESRTMVVMILVLSTFLSARFDLIAALRGSLLLLFDRQSLYSLTQSLCDSTLPLPHYLPHSSLSPSSSVRDVLGWLLPGLDRTAGVHLLDALLELLVLRHGAQYVFIGSF
jgi:hypothetical protein